MNILVTDQLQRAAVSISSNIAEGAAKPSDIEFAHFLDTALGSAFEVETQLLIARNVGYLHSKNDNHNDNLNVKDNGNWNGNLNADDNDNDNGVSYEDLLSDLHYIERQINGLIKNIRNS